MFLGLGSTCPQLFMGLWNQKPIKKGTEARGCITNVETCFFMTVIPKRRSYCVIYLHEGRRTSTFLKWVPDGEQKGIVVVKIFLHEPHAFLFILLKKKCIFSRLLLVIFEENHLQRFRDLFLMYKQQWTGHMYWFKGTVPPE